jgi:hypothetical protein
MQISVNTGFWEELVTPDFTMLSLGPTYLVMLMLHFGYESA